MTLVVEEGNSVLLLACCLVTAVWFGLLGLVNLIEPLKLLKSKFGQGFNSEFQ